MSQTITRLYNSRAEARAAVSRLEAAGVSHGDISILVSNADNAYDEKTKSFPDRDLDGKDDRAEGAAAGGGVGAAIGGAAGLLTGLGLIAIPGVGPVVAAGWLVATLTGAVAGGATGGVIGGTLGVLAGIGALAIPGLGATLEKLADGVDVSAAVEQIADAGSDLSAIGA